MAKTNPEKAPTRRERERARHREEILREAERIFAERGYERASMSEIAAAAEFSVGSLYNFFRDKAALGEEVMVRICRERAEELEALAGRRLSPAAALRELALGFARHLAAHGAFLRMSLALQTSRGHELPPPRVLAFVERQREALVGLFRRAAGVGAMRPLPPADLATAAAGLCIHFASDWRWRGGDFANVPERELGERIAVVLQTLLLERPAER